MIDDVVAVGPSYRIHVLKLIRAPYIIEIEEDDGSVEMAREFPNTSAPNLLDQTGSHERCNPVGSAR